MLIATNKRHVVKVFFHILYAIGVTVVIYTADCLGESPRAENEDEPIVGQFVVTSKGYELAGTAPLPMGTRGSFKYTGDKLELSIDGADWLPGVKGGLAFKPDGQTCFVASMSDGVKYGLVKMEGYAGRNLDGSRYVSASYDATVAAEAGIKGEVCLRWVVDRSFRVRTAASGGQVVLVRSTIESRLTPRLVTQGRIAIEAEAKLEQRVGMALAMRLPEVGEPARAVESYCLDEDLPAPDPGERVDHYGWLDEHVVAALVEANARSIHRDQMQDHLWKTERAATAVDLSWDMLLYAIVMSSRNADGDLVRMSELLFPNYLSVTHVSDVNSLPAEMRMILMLGQIVPDGSEGAFIVESTHVRGAQRLANQGSHFLDRIHHRAGERGVVIAINGSRYRERFGRRLNSALKMQIDLVQDDDPEAEILTAIEGAESGGWVFLRMSILVDTVSLDGD